jgi:hypothetical protein
MSTSGSLPISFFYFPKQTHSFLSSGRSNQFLFLSFKAQVNLLKLFQIKIFLANILFDHTLTIIKKKPILCRIFPNYCYSQGWALKKQQEDYSWQTKRRYLISKKKKNQPNNLTMIFSNLSTCFYFILCHTLCSIQTKLKSKWILTVCRLQRVQSPEKTILYVL